jgi:acetyl-CoA carboxylase carboxyltransferase component
MGVTMDMKKKLDEFKAVREKLSFGGGKAAVDRQHAAGKLTAWERMDLLFDPGTFRELDLLAKPFKTGFDIDNRELPRDAIVVGYGSINGRTVYASCYDYTVAGGSQGSMQMMKLVKVMEQARKEGLPYVTIIDSTGRRIQDRFGRFGYRVPIRVEDCGEGQVDMFCPPMASGVIPQISLMLGPCYAGTAYCPMMSDFLIFRKELAFMSVASPALLKSATSANVTQDEIGGALLHATTTGSADILVDSDEEALAKCRELLEFLPSNWTEKPPVSQTGDDPQRREEELLSMILEEEDKPLDMHRLISLVVDEGRFFEIAPLYARNMITGFARLSGRTVGIIANNSMVAEGCLDANACDKEAHFIRTCDCFNIPLIFLVDSPGFLPSLTQEQSPEGIERHAAKPVFALCEATVPKIVVYVRKVFGSTRLIMGGRGMNVDSVLAWPSVRFNFGSYPVNEPYTSGAVMAFEEVIDPRETRPIVIERLHRLSHKQMESRPWRKHGLIQL